MILEYPLREECYENMLMTKEKTAIAYYRIRSESVMLTDSDNKLKTKKKVARILARLEPNKSFEIELLPVNSDFREKMGEMLKIVDPKYHKVASNKFKRTVLSLENEMGTPCEYIWIVGVPLFNTDYSKGIKEVIKQQVNHYSENIANGLGYEIELNPNWYQDYEEQENEVYQNLSELLVERLTEEDLYYYQSYQFLPDISHSRQEVKSCQALDNIIEARIKPLMTGGLRFNTECGEGYASYLPVGDMGVFLDNNHLLEIVQKMPFFIRVKLQANFAEKVGTTNLTGRSGRSRTRVKNIMSEAKIAGSKQKRKILEGQLSLDDLDQKIDDDEPIIDWTATLVVTGKTKKQLKARRKYLMNRFSSLKIPLLKTVFDDVFLFQNNLYGNFERSKPSKWLHTSTIRTFCELNFFTSLKCGSNIGFYLGRVDNTLSEKENVKSMVSSSKNIILLNILLSNKQDIKGKRANSPHVLITGDTGSGKSVFAKKLFMENALLKDVKELFVDPKCEVRDQFLAVIQDEAFRQAHPDDVAMIESFNFVTLDNKNQSNVGVLDPILLFSESEAIPLCKELISNVYNGAWSIKQKNALNESVESVVFRHAQGEQVGFWHVVEQMIDSKVEEVRELGQLIRSTIKNSVFELAFSHGEVEGLSLNEKVTILEISNLNLPKSKNEVLNDTKRLSINIMMIIGAFCKAFGANRKEETVVFLDEAWIFEVSAIGKEIIKEMKRMGRSCNNFLVEITQSVNDSEDEDESTGFGIVVAFSESRNNEGVLRYLNLPVTDENLKWVSNMVQGQCLIKDVTNQVNRAAVHILFDEWLELFKTIDDTEATRLEKRFVA
ncbi:MULTISPECIES: ATP-binding protein [unclassified Enterococcus]|uniref:ATP-binding protein n=1 Tax=unclassified Enterococcus TaxID=2608891 RepID=UPI0015521BC6|nr:MULTISPECIES: ATP-binding protein [unclassified Enterococcus]MBS7576970.1 ATP-binding protein [Enterococcus sp. MMGLQ5-2]MBS7584377.1 ATP-binding protein [Enterococcus sp. MMGLQ5-1]NPD12232.1 conjugal transfer protein [Enterococcus sp. MMGLQ5-1]NPD36804.1 conjugal transfer protein [Enterococcus sp. MMGLQ5-2]